MTAPDGFCLVERWTMLAGHPQYPSQILGLVRWSDLLAYMATNQATEPSPGVWETVEPSGEVTRYSAVCVAEGAL